MPFALDLPLLALISIRLGAALRLTPFLGGRPLGIVPWLSVTAVLAPIIGLHSGPLPSHPLEPAIWVSAALAELFIGITIGMLAKIAFTVFETAGNLARLQTLAVPTSGDEGSLGGAPISTAYVLVGTAAFLLMDGHHYFITALAATTRCMPPGAVPGLDHLASTGGASALHLFTLAMATAALISIPVFAAGLFADLLVGLAAPLWPGAAPGTGILRIFAVQGMIIAAFSATILGLLHFLVSEMKNLDMCVGF